MTTLQLLIDNYAHSNIITLLSSCTAPQLSDLFTIPDIESKWFDVGVALGLNQRTLQDIQQQYKNDNRRKREMFKCRLEQSKVTWRMLVHVLLDIGEAGAARRVCEEYSLPSSLLEERSKLTKTVSVCDCLCLPCHSV